MDIIFCILVMPGMMFLFPLAEWMSVHPGYVLVYILWLYIVYGAGRFSLGPLLMAKTWRRFVTVAGILVLIAALTFLMTLTQVDFVQDATRVERMPLHETAMWVLLIAVLSYAMPVGMLAQRLAFMRRQATREAVKDAAREALETRRMEAEEVTGEEICVKADYKTIHVPLSAIQYIEGRNNYACLHLDHRDDVVTQLTLKNLLEMLPEGRFLRIHRSFIVPVWRIEKRTATQVRLLGVQDPLPVGRAFKDQLKDAK